MFRSIFQIWENLKSVNPEFITYGEVVSNIDKALEKWTSRLTVDVPPEKDFSSESILWRDEVEPTLKKDEL